MKRILIGLVVIIAVLFLGGLYTNLVNPYSPLTLVKPFFTTSVGPDGQITLAKNAPIYVVHTPFDWPIHMMFSTFRIFGNARFSEEPFTGSEDDIIAAIHKERFDVTKPYVISAGHFAELYPRNFGLFYSAVLDGRIPSSEKDWEDRQRVTVQTVATDLELMKEAGKTYSTFELITPNTFVGQKVYTEQSDSIFAVMWTLRAMTDDTFLSTVFSASTSAKPLQTKQVGQKLIAAYTPSLEKITNDYLAYVIDPKTGIIRKDITLSSARDGIMRQSSFYDNVIAWSTAKMATDLGLKIQCPAVLQKNDICDFAGWKQKIITAFWDNSTGIFLDDLSDESINNHIYSGDAFIVTSTQFLDFTNPDDKAKIEKEIAYVQARKLDQPFALRYAIKDQPDRLYWPVKYFTPSYMGKSIWSHWGMEYIKTLVLLSHDKPEYLAQAQQQVQKYNENIVKYGGYPELYDADGSIFETPFYKSLLHTGWVINYEQTKMMFQSAKD